MTGSATKQKGGLRLCWQNHRCQRCTQYMWLPAFTVECKLDSTGTSSDMITFNKPIPILFATNSWYPFITDWIVSPQGSYVETLSPNVTVFGDTAFKEVITVKWSPKHGAVIQRDWHLRKVRVKRNVHMYWGKATWGHKGQTANCKPKRDGLGWPTPALTLVLDFQPPEL